MEEYRQEKSTNIRESEKITFIDKNTPYLSLIRSHFQACSQSGTPAVYCGVSWSSILLHNHHVFAKNFWNYQNVLKFMKGNAQNMAFAVSTIFHRNDTPRAPVGPMAQIWLVCSGWWWVGEHLLMIFSHKCFNWQTKIAQLTRLGFYLILFIFGHPHLHWGVPMAQKPNIIPKNGFSEGMFGVASLKNSVVDFYFPVMKN